MAVKITIAIIALLISLSQSWPTTTRRLGSVSCRIGCSVCDQQICSKCYDRYYKSSSDCEKCTIPDCKRCESFSQCSEYDSHNSGSIIEILMGVIFGVIFLSICGCVLWSFCYLCRLPVRNTTVSVINNPSRRSTTVPQSNNFVLPPAFSAPNAQLNPSMHVQHHNEIMLQYAPPVQQPILYNPDAARSLPPPPTSAASQSMPPPMYEVNIASNNTQTNQTYPKPYQPKL